MKLIWTGEALEKLAETEKFISQDNPLRAEEFIDYLIKKAETISLNPAIGRIVPEISNPSIREIIVRNYRIVYRLTDTSIEILTVFEGHKLFETDES